MTFIEMVMAAGMTAGGLVGIALLFFLFFYIGVQSLIPKKKHHPKNVDIIVSQAKSRARQ
jgi:hypothetical protein